MTKIELMSRTVDNWKSDQTKRKSNEPPQLTEEQIRIVENRIKNWDKRNG